MNIKIEGWGWNEVARGMFGLCARIRKRKTLIDRTRALTGNRQIGLRRISVKT